jgi:hypothetical protein
MTRVNSSSYSALRVFFEAWGRTQPTNAASQTASLRQSIDNNVTLINPQVASAGRLRLTASTQAQTIATFWNYQCLPLFRIAYTHQQTRPILYGAMLHRLAQNADKDPGFESLSLHEIINRLTHHFASLTAVPELSELSQLDPYTSLVADYLNDLAFFHSKVSSADTLAELE